MTDDQLLAEIEDILRTMPDRSTIHHEKPENVAWFGRALSGIENWDSIKGVRAIGYIEQFMSAGNAHQKSFNLPKLQILLNQALSDLRFKTIGPVNIAIGQGEVFRYFDAIRAVIELANSDLFFVDRYMGPDFVSKYLPLVRPGVTVRLLTLDKLPALIASTTAYARQHSTLIEVRSGAGFHDRWIFVDRMTCYQSGASFKDGGMKDATTLTQNTDAFSQLLTLYEGLWQTAKQHNLLP
jgi:hypothetical protein